jgi:hypothetical protein
MAQGPHQFRTIPGGASNAGGDNQIPPDMSERLARLEGAFDGLKMSIDGLRHGQNITIGLLSVGFAILSAFMFYMLNRIDNLPAEFERMNQTLSSAITATRQQAQQVILLPAPQLPQTPPEQTPTPKQ